VRRRREVIRPGVEWGSPASGPPDIEVVGCDSDLAGWVGNHLGARIRFRPQPRSDVALAIGLDAARAPEIELPMDALRWENEYVTNMAVLGTAPDRLRRWSRRVHFRVYVDGEAWFDGPATTVVVATGQFLRGNDLVPRSHPGDGRAEIQVYSVAPAERAAVRARVRNGSHLPHPHIAQRTGRHVEVRAARAVPLNVDGHGGTATSLVLDIVPAAYRLLV
jgi:diacylglycerol kinase family enzyme